MPRRKRTAKKRRVTPLSDIPIKAMNHLFDIPGLSFPRNKDIIGENNHKLWAGLGAVDRINRPAKSRLSIVKRLTLIFRSLCATYKRYPVQRSTSTLQQYKPPFEFWEQALRDIARRDGNMAQFLTPNSLRSLVFIYTDAWKAAVEDDEKLLLGCQQQELANLVITDANGSIIELGIEVDDEVVKARKSEKSDKDNNRIVNMEQPQPSTRVLFNAIGAWNMASGLRKFFKQKTVEKALKDWAEENKDEPVQPWLSALPQTFPDSPNKPSVRRNSDKQDQDEIPLWAGERIESMRKAIERKDKEIDRKEHVILSLIEKNKQLKEELVVEKGINNRNS